MRERMKAHVANVMSKWAAALESTTDGPAAREVLKNFYGNMTGQYSIQLVDERGRTKDIVKTNYITPLWEIFAKSYSLHFPFMYKFPYGATGSATATGNATQNYPGRTLMPTGLRPFPWQSVILTDSDEAEDTDSHWLKGSVTAWSSLWKTAAIPASGRRGQINEAECAITANGQVIKWVWDWSTQQGNGTYQTLGMGMIARPDVPCQLIAIGPNLIQGPTSVEPTWGGSGTPNVTDFYITNGKMIACAYRTGPNDYVPMISIADVPAGIWSSDVDGSGHIFDAYTGVTWTPIGTTGPGGLQNTTSSSTNQHTYWNKRGWFFDPTDNTQLYYGEGWASGLGKIGRMTISTGAAGWTFQPFNGTAWSSGTGGYNGSHNVDIAIVSGKIYACCAGKLTADNVKILRIDRATGAYEASFTLPIDAQCNGGMTTDGTNLFIVTNLGLLEITVTGTLVQNLGWPAGAASHFSNETGAVPWNSGTSTGQFYGYRAGSEDFAWLHPAMNVNNIMYYNDNNGVYDTLSLYPYAAVWTSGNPDANRDVGDRRLVWTDNKLWMAYTGHSPNSRHSIQALTGANCISRALLDTPVVKSSTQTMKVSFELSRPDMDLLWPVHMAP
jgi:hypothetical protein